MAKSVSSDLYNLLKSVVMTDVGVVAFASDAVAASCSYGGNH